MPHILILTKAATKVAVYGFVAGAVAVLAAPAALDLSKTVISKVTGLFSKKATQS
jgi:hypothetical protein